MDGMERRVRPAMGRVEHNGLAMNPTLGRGTRSINGQSQSRFFYLCHDSGPQAL